MPTTPPATTLDALGDATALATLDQAKITQQAESIETQARTIADQAAEIARLQAIIDAGGGGEEPVKPLSIDAWTVSHPAGAGVVVKCHFSKAITVASLSLKDLTLHSGAGGSKVTPALTFVYDVNENRATYTFGTIAAGTYIAFMPKSGVTDAAGASMAEDQASPTFTVAAGPTPPEPPLPPLPPLPATWPTRPAPPVLPEQATAVFSQPTVPITASADFNGKTFVQTDNGQRPVLFDVKASALTVRHAYAKSKDGTAGGFDVSQPRLVCEDFYWLDNSGWIFTIRAGGAGAVIRRQRARTFVRYFCFVENSDCLLEDIDVHDDGADGIPGTPDDDGASDWESVIRVEGGTLKCRRIRIIYGPNHPSVKACFRGDGVIDCEDIYTEGAISGFNGLGKGDGGQGELLDRAGGVKFSNPDQVRKGVRQMAIASPNATPMDFARFVRTVARVNDKPWNPTDAQLQGFLDSRKAQLGRRAASTWRRSENRFGYSIEAGSVTTFEATNKIVGDPRNGGAPFSAQVSEYPPGVKVNGAGVETDPGWRFPFDVLRPKPKVICKGSADGKEWPRFYGTGELIWMLTLAQALPYFTGKFFYNDVLIDTGRPAA